MKSVSARNVTSGMIAYSSPKPPMKPTLAALPDWATPTLFVLVRLYRKLPNATPALVYIRYSPNATPIRPATSPAHGFVVLALMTVPSVVALLSTFILDHQESASRPTTKRPI